jgi:putative ABC transport system ATP-binding protein
LRKVGLVFQEFELIEYLNAEENILLPLRLGGRLANERSSKERLSELAERTGITHTLARRPAQLSHGERQRVALCRALLQEPPLVLADEPTGSLDPSTSEAVIELLFAEVDRTKAALLMVTHHHDVVSRFDRVLPMDTAVERSP